MEVSVPYLAPACWYSVWLEDLLGGASDREARRIANRRTGCVERGGCRQWSRTGIGGVAGVRLSVPICGGTSAAKRLSPEDALVSSHGDWPRQHLGALEALCGRTPYHSLLLPDLERIIRSAPGDTLARLGENIHSLILKILGFPEALETLRSLPPDEREHLRRIGEELRRGIDPGMTFWEWISRLGPSALPALIL